MCTQLGRTRNGNPRSSDYNCFHVSLLRWQLPCLVVRAASPSETLPRCPVPIAPLATIGAPLSPLCPFSHVPISAFYPSRPNKSTERHSGDRTSTLQHQLAVYKFFSISTLDSRGPRRLRRNEHPSLPPSLLLPNSESFPREV